MSEKKLVQSCVLRSVLYTVEDVAEELLAERIPSELKEEARRALSALVREGVVVEEKRAGETLYLPSYS